MPKGNEYLSGWDHQLWDMVYHILFKFQVPVMFKDFQGSVPERRDTFLQWFVPEGSNYEAVEHFILDEFEKDIKEGKDISFSDKGEKIYSIGLHVSVYPFAGISPYLERKYAEPIAKELVEKLFRGLFNDKSE